MDNKTKELIAIGASITANCQPCFTYHAGKAREYGATDDEIADAVAMGKAVRTGAAGKMDQFLGSAVGNADPGEGASGCGCSAQG